MICEKAFPEFWCWNGENQEFFCHVSFLALFSKVISMRSLLRFGKAVVHIQSVSSSEWFDIPFSYWHYNIHAWSSDAISILHPHILKNFLVSLRSVLYSQSTWPLNLPYVRDHIAAFPWKEPAIAMTVRTKEFNHFIG